MITTSSRVLVVTLVLALMGCTQATESADPFPTAAFTAIREDPLSEAMAARFQMALEQYATKDGPVEEWGMTATVMTADGTWSGTVGKADGVRDLGVDDQFAIASITKSVVAAQIMLMVEAGELGLDDPVDHHLPPDLDLDTNEATVRHLLGQRSGIPDYYDLIYESQRTEPGRAWASAEVVKVLPAHRTPSGSAFQYTETNYLLLGMVIEHLRGPLAEALRDGALAVDGTERLIHQPRERPTEPMAMPGGDSTADLEMRGGYLPSLANVTAFSGSGAMASDSPSLARWWRAFCAGEIVSEASLAEMADFEEGWAYDGAYGLGLYNPAHGYARGVGHTGELFGYMSWAACLPEDEAVIVVLTNRRLDDGHFAFIHEAARPLVEVLRSG